MSNVLDRQATATPQPSAIVEAAEGIIDTLCVHMKPKARAKALADLDAYLARLERDPASGLPNNVRPLRAASYQSAADAQDRASRAAALRFLIGECF